MKKSILLLAVVLLFQMSSRAQSPVVVPAELPEPSPNEFILLQTEPMPLNLDSVRSLIVYPQVLKDVDFSGKVVVRILLDQQGHYVKHLVLKDPHPLLTKAITDVVSYLRFSPGIAAGAAIKVWVTIPFDFRLNKTAPPAEKTTAKLQSSYYSIATALACADRTMVGELYLNGQQISVLPKEILLFPNLRRLELKDNQLTTLPEELATMKNLKVLGLANNNFTVLPAVVSSMPGLVQVIVQGNAFSKTVQKNLEKELGAKLFPKDPSGHVIW